MRIIPAIDIIDGKCVRLTQGDYNRKKVYNEDPVEVARMFEAADIKYLHLVDLDGAKSGHIVNHRVLESIAKSTRLQIDFGGGVKSDIDIAIAFNSGAQQVTCGSIAVKDKKKMTEWIEIYGKEKIILGADVKNMKVAINGWTEETTVSIFDLIQGYMDQGLEYVICTDIATDGMLTGPNQGLYNKLLDVFSGIKLIASGGVSNLDDVKSLGALNVEGIIIGKAIYEGKITLQELTDIQNA